ncbi:MAG: EamA family transporter [Candidatus Schekmanbacteria bacterium]|nr:EamA family transporter [Candidatus Schekmanbacteria bacterium]
MLWIPMVISAAVLNALWTALSQKHLTDMSSFNFTLLLRGLTTIFFFPFFLLDLKWPLSLTFWLAAGGAGLLEVVRIGYLAYGIRSDYYSTYAIYNTAPLFTLMMVPFILPEKISLLLWLGVSCIVIGAFIFYGMGKLSIPGLICAITSSLSAVLSKIALNESPAIFFIFVSFAIGVFSMLFFARTIQKRDLHFLWHWPIVNKLLPLAFFSALATALYYMALDLAPVSKVQPLVRANLLFGFIFSYFLLKEKDNWQKKLFAGGVIFIGCILIGLA